MSYFRIVVKNLRSANINVISKIPNTNLIFQ